MFGRTLLIVFSSILFLVSTSLVEAASWYTFTPGPTIAMTGSNDQVFFDVADDITNSGSTIPAPHLITSMRTFSGAFYLSGAGWVDFSSSDSVILDCGVQSLYDLTADCAITGTGYSEIIGDVVFSGAGFRHQTGEITGTLSTFIGDYSLSGVRLPLFPAFFIEGTGSTADSTTSLSISGSSRYFGSGDWDVYALATGDMTNVCTGVGSSRSCDFSMASDYAIEIEDPNDSKTTFLYKVDPGVPASTAPFALTYHQNFCSANPADPRCPDGANLSAMVLSKVPSAGTVIANGGDTYSFTLRIRDQYGNATSGGNVTIEYTDGVKNLQVDQTEYANYIIEQCVFGPSGCAVDSPELINNYGDFSLTIPVTGDIMYTFSSIAPTDTANTLSLSGIVFDGIDITDPSWRTPLTFTPWYDTSLSVVGNIIVGTGVSFASSLNQNGALSSLSVKALYQTRIGDNSLASFENFTTSDCTKYYLGVGVDQCNWSDPSAVIHATDVSSFTGIYTPHVPTPPTETASYKSYITYEKGGIRVLYPSTSGNLGGAQYGQSPLRVLGQSNLGGQYGGIGSKSRSDFWNTLRRDIALLSRNRTSYIDVDYLVETGSTLMVTDASFATKRTLITIGQDIHITGDIAKGSHPLSLIALTDSAGNGGDITIDASVRNISLSLFAEHGVSSAGSNQLLVFGSLISSNTTGGASASPEVCPYFITSCTKPLAEKYDLEKLRPDFDKNDLSSKSIGPTALANPGVATIIEYDGRILSDPPPGVGK